MSNRLERSVLAETLEGIVRRALSSSEVLAEIRAACEGQYNSNTMTLDTRQAAIDGAIAAVRRTVLCTRCPKQGRCKLTAPAPACIEDFRKEEATRA
jgi:hypothetical protein